MGNFERARLQSDYVLFIDEVAEYLESIKCSCSDLILNDIELIKFSFLEKMERFCNQFEIVAAGIPSDRLGAHIIYFREKIHPFILESEIVKRIFNKPLGYPGDYEMINLLMGETTSGTTGLFPALIDQMHIMAITAQAHKNRIAMMLQRINREVEKSVRQERFFSILCIGCGPAIELQRFIISNQLSNNCFIHVIDFNQEAVKYIEQRLSECRQIANRSTMIESSYIGLPDLINSQDENFFGDVEAFDVVYCAGLFDYISDDLCRSLIQFCYSCLRPQGLLTVTNVHPSVPHKHYLHQALEWTFIYRTEAQMELLASESLKFQTTTDPTGLNVFLDIVK